MAEILRTQPGGVRLSTLLQVAELEGFTGRVHIGQAGHVDVLQGDIVAAACGVWAGSTALYELFLEDQAALWMETTPPPEGRRLGALLALIVEGCRLYDEWVELRGHGFRWRSSPPVSPAWAAALQGQSLPAFAAQHQLPRHLIADHLRRWIEEGKIEATAAPSLPEVERADPDDLLLDARKMVRLGRLEEATRCLQRALALRPHDPIIAQNLRRVEALKEAAR